MIEFCIVFKKTLRETVIKRTEKLYIIIHYMNNKMTDGRIKKDRERPIERNKGMKNKEKN